jgi:ribosomal-protein-alanine N-acetyltransferase
VGREGARPAGLTVARRGLLDVPSARGRDEFLAAAARSAALHRHWARPPGTADEFAAYLARLRRDAHVGYWVRTEEGALAGAIHVSEIVRGAFRSAYLGYYAFLPHAGRGYMTRGLAAVLADAFGRQGLHRLEANLQPDNERSRRLVERCGFRLEGYSPRYLKLAGRWRDHERWAITVEDWRARRKEASR